MFQPRTSSRQSLTTVIAGCVSLAITSAAQGQPPSFLGLGDLPGGAVASKALAISADGSTVVGWSSSGSGNEELFRWTPGGGLVGLGSAPSGSQTLPSLSVSSNGGVIAGVLNGTSFTWTQPTGLALFQASEVFISDVSGDGTQLVGFNAIGSYRWSMPGGFEQLGNLPGGSGHSSALAISTDGSTVVGDSESPLGHQAYRWTSVGMTGLGDLPGGDFYSYAWDVSASGSVVVGESSYGSGRQAFRWTESEGMVGLGSLPALPSSSARSISADGTIIVGHARGVIAGLTEIHAFIWDSAHGMRDLQELLETQYGLDLQGWRLKYATAISADGKTIVGWGDNPQGATEAFIVQLPEPCTAMLLLIAGLGIRRRF